MKKYRILLFFALITIILNPKLIMAKASVEEFNIDCKPTVNLTITDKDGLSKEGYSRLNDIIKIRNRACQTVLKSKKHADDANYYFRKIGILIVFISALIPFLSCLDGTIKILSFTFSVSWKKSIAIASLFIAIMAGINKFYDFKGTWGFSRLAEYQLRTQIIKWEQKISEAQYNYLKNKDESEFLNAATSITNTLLDEWDKSIKNRAEQYFNDQHFEQDISS